MIRPEHVALDAREGDIACRVQRIQLLGGLIRYTVRSRRVARRHSGRSDAAVARDRRGRRRVPAHSAADAVLYHR